MPTNMIFNTKPLTVSVTRSRFSLGSRDLRQPSWWVTTNFFENPCLKKIFFLNFKLKHWRVLYIWFHNLFKIISKIEMLHLLCCCCCCCCLVVSERDGTAIVVVLISHTWRIMPMPDVDAVSLNKMVSVIAIWSENGLPLIEKYVVEDV